MESLNKTRRNARHAPYYEAKHGHGIHGTLVTHHPHEDRQTVPLYHSQSTGKFQWQKLKARTLGPFITCLSIIYHREDSDSDQVHRFTFTVLSISIRGLKPSDTISTARTSKASQGRKPKIKAARELSAPALNVAERLAYKHGSAPRPEPSRQLPPDTTRQPYLQPTTCNATTEKTTQSADSPMADGGWRRRKGKGGNKPPGIGSHAACHWTPHTPSP
eukprot:scaffold126165_cov33-Tisochrysis_lutea.AAC.1